jgi:hypothetical protein
LKHDTLENWEKSTLSLALGEVAFAECTDGSFQMRVGDGEHTWSELSASPIKWSADQIEGLNDAIASLSTTHYEVSDLAELSNTYNNGDTAVVKKTIAGGKESYTAYVYDAPLSNWKAMDGNYSAENVYFENDFTCAGTYTRVGNVTKTETGTATLSAAGKSLKDVIQSIFTERQQPSSGNTDPSVSLTASALKAYEVGTKSITPSWSASLNPGSYKFGPATGITAKSWSVKNNTTTETSTEASGSFNAVAQVTDTTSYQLTATASYDAGAVAKDNLGDPSSPTVQIAAGSKEKASGTITGFRNTLYGILTEKKELTSDVIRGLANKTTSKLNNTTLAVGGAVRVVIAIPKAKPSNAKGSYNTCDAAKLSKVLDVNDSNSNLNGQFTKIYVDVKGAEGYDAISYSVYYIDFSGPHSTDNFVITQ